MRALFLYICLHVGAYTRTCVCLCMCVWMSIRPSIPPSVCLSVCLPVCLSVCMYVLACACVRACTSVRACVRTEDVRTMEQKRNERISQNIQHLKSRVSSKSLRCLVSSITYSVSLPFLHYLAISRPAERWRWSATDRELLAKRTEIQQISTLIYLPFYLTPLTSWP